jgi:hypothetical protein
MRGRLVVERKGTGLKSRCLHSAIPVPRTLSGGGIAELGFFAQGETVFYELMELTSSARLAQVLNRMTTRLVFT